jgi:hypothetical protein
MLATLREIKNGRNTMLLELVQQLDIIGIHHAVTGACHAQHVIHDPIAVDSMQGWRCASQIRPCRAPLALVPSAEPTQKFVLVHDI